ncbi:MAG: peptidase M28, partial [Cytophagaceae bacterium]
MQKLLFALAAAGTLAGPALAQSKAGTSPAPAAEKIDPAALAKIKDEGLNRSQVMETAFYLTDVCGPRLAGSEGLARANAWTKKRLADYGLANANVEPWGDFGRGWDIDKSYVAMTAPYYHAMIGVPKAWTPSTPGSLRKQVVV